METVAPFRAWRYASSAGDPADLVAPPYDVIGPDLHCRLYARSPYNVVRVDLGLPARSDNERDNQYTRAAAQLVAWKQTGILVRDPQPSLTFVEEHFRGPDGRTRVRHGFLGAMRLYDFDQGVVFPHERTLSGPKEDRYRLMVATGMSLSPVFLLYDLPSDEITAAWKSTLADKPPAVALTDDTGTTTKLWPTADPDLLQLVKQDLETSRFIIADGHHRYETALRYQKHRREEERARDQAPEQARGQAQDRAREQAREGPRQEEQPPQDQAPRAYDYALAYFTNTADPGLAVYSIHRLVAGLDPALVANLPQRLAETFAVEPLTSGSPGPTAAEAQAAITAYLESHPHAAFGLWGRELDAAYGLQLVDMTPVRAFEPDHNSAYQELDVTILQTLVLQRALGISAADIAAEKHLSFFTDTAEAFARLEAGEFQVGFFMNPIPLEQIRQVAFGGERMPQKATFFYPKLPTGLVFHDLNGSL